MVLRAAEYRRLTTRNPQLSRTAHQIIDAVKGRSTALRRARLDITGRGINAAGGGSLSGTRPGRGLAEETADARPPGRIPCLPSLARRFVALLEEFEASPLQSHLAQPRRRYARVPQVASPSRTSPWVVCPSDRFGIDYRCNDKTVAASTRWVLRLLVVPVPGLLLTIYFRRGPDGRRNACRCFRDGVFADPGGANKALNPCAEPVGGITTPSTQKPAHHLRSRSTNCSANWSPIGRKRNPIASCLRSTTFDPSVNNYHPCPPRHRKSPNIL